MIALLLSVMLAAEPDPELAPLVEPAPKVQPQSTGEKDEDFAALKDELEQAKARLEALEAKSTFLSRLSARFFGYLDVGFFVVQGNGSGVRKDLGHSQSQYNDLLGAWVLLGDPLGTQINSRGEPADVGDSRAIRFDPIHAGGHPSFIVNALNLSMRASLTDDFTLTTSLDLLPRDRDIRDFRGLGDFFDLKLAFLRYEFDLGPTVISIHAGKFESLHGIEYRTQESTQRIGITPSLICRYTCGRPVGIKASAGFFARQLEIALALTNGSHQSDLFPFSNETDFNGGKTVTGRVQYTIPLLNKGIELSASGSIGTQDRQSDDSVLQWHYGFAALVALGDFTGSAEFVTGRAQGKSEPVTSVPCAAAPCLLYRGMYGQLAWRANNYLVPYVRVDWRNASHRRGLDWAYASTAVRGTFGLHVDLNSFLRLKAEYVLNREVDILEFPDDVFTSSLVVKY